MAPMQSAQNSKIDFDVITFWYAELMMRESSYDPVSKLALESFSARLISPSILSVISTVAREAVVLLGLPFNTVTLLARGTVVFVLCGTVTLLACGTGTSLARSIVNSVVLAPVSSSIFTLLFDVCSSKPSQNPRSSTEGLRVVWNDLPKLFKAGFVFVRFAGLEKTTHAKFIHVHCKSKKCFNYTGKNLLVAKKVNTFNI